MPVIAWLLLQGNNESAILQLRYNRVDRTGYVSFNEAFKCAQSQKIHPKLKLRYVELILVMFVAVGENRSFLDHLCYSFVSCNFQQLAAWWSCQFKLDQLQLKLSIYCLCIADMHRLYKT